MKRVVSPHPQGLQGSHLNLSQTSAQRHRTYFLLNNNAVKRGSVRHMTDEAAPAPTFKKPRRPANIRKRGASEAEADADADAAPAGRPGCAAPQLPSLGPRPAHAALRFVGTR